MEIVALKATLSEQTLNEVVARHLPADAPVEDLRLAITPEGIVVKGEYPLLVTVAFETLWEPSVADGKLVVRLARLRTLGMPMTVLRSVVMTALAAAARTEAWIQVDKDHIRIDVDGALAKEGLRARVNLKSVTCQPGVLVIEAGKATA
jgi:hypothetical protein